MTIGKSIAMGCIAVLADWASGRQASPPEEIVIRVKHGNVPRLTAAEWQADLILRQVGVRIRWETRNHNAEAYPGLPGCMQHAADISVIDLDVLDQSDHSDHPGALGYAKPFERSGVRVVVFNDRVTAMAPGPGLLGHVIAHEVGHMLIGMPTHSDFGLMRAKWNEHDVLNMRWRPLEFAEPDTEMIAINLERRRKVCGSMEAVAVVRDEAATGESRGRARGWQSRRSR